MITQYCKDSGNLFTMSTIPCGAHQQPCWCLALHSLVPAALPASLALPPWTHCTTPSLKHSRRPHPTTYPHHPNLSWRAIRLTLHPCSLFHTHPSHLHSHSNLCPWPTDYLELKWAALDATGWSQCILHAVDSSQLDIIQLNSFLFIQSQITTTVFLSPYWKVDHTIIHKEKNPTIKIGF